MRRGYLLELARVKITFKIGFQQLHTPCRTRPLKPSLLLQCHTNLCIKGAWHTAVPTHHTNNSTPEFPPSLTSFSVHKQQTILCTAHESTVRRFCWEGLMATQGTLSQGDHNSFLPQTRWCQGPATQTTEESPNHTPQIHRQIHFCSCYCLQNGLKIKSILNSASVKGVRGMLKLLPGHSVFYVAHSFVQCWNRAYQRFLGRNDDNKTKIIQLVIC